MTFDYAGYYRRTQELEALQIPANAIHWVERYQRPAGRGARPLDGLGMLVFQGAIGFRL